MQAAELCLRALKIATDSSQRSDIRLKCQSLLDEAERIKLVDEWQPLALQNPSPHLTPLESSNTHLEASSMDVSSSDLISTLNLDDVTTRDTPSVVPPKPSSSFKELPRKPTSITRLREPCSTRELTKSEQIILLRGSKLNGFQFPPWKAAPGSECFELVEGEQLFL
jgi:calpain-7